MSASAENSFRPSYHEAQSIASGKSNGSISISRQPAVPVVDDVLRGFTEYENSIKRNYMTIDALISHPICCGYLLLFCTSQFNAENLRFILDVDDFRDLFLVDPANVWERTWKQIDQTVDITSNVVVNEINLPSWPSVADKGAALKKINYIIETYVEHDAPSQVCISESLTLKTRNRIKLLHLYGPEVFEEACIDPIKTMRKDILPRFLMSPVFERMIKNLATTEPPPPASDLKVPPPESHILMTSPISEFPESRQYTLDEVLGTSVLYNNFRNYLLNIRCEENLVCVRMITVFDNLVAVTKDSVQVHMQAWRIYKYFVAPGAAFEVSIHHLHRKHAMFQLAQPEKGMFEHVRRSAYGILKLNFENYKKTPSYDSLGKLMLEAKREILRVQSTKKSSFGCFDFIPGMVLRK